MISQYGRARERLDLPNINKQIAKAEKMIAGDQPVKKDRFVRFTSKAMVLDRGVQSIHESRVVADCRAQDSPVKTDDSALVVAGNAV
ncbi:hypothetical protein [Nocardia sp. NPDC050710]|uniref:hypothetical protein n=1 Tax=Nocardia sp. NPDC050710 TaxID=3157220 RepID=UPI0033F20DFA